MNPALRPVKPLQPGWPGADPAQVQPGMTLGGRFVLHEILGEGGTGRVFRATDVAVWEEVAVKVLLEEPSPRMLARLAREVRVARRISHPNIVRVFDFISLPEERLHLMSMQYVRGSPLSRRVAAQGPLSGRDLRRLFQSMASALGAAHRHGIVHRDLKPENVQLRDDGEPFLLDFGSAAEEGAAALTADGFAPGTPEFMAPEQREGLRATPRADVYALGLCVAFAAGASIEEGRVLRGPPAFGTLLARCLHADPARRFRDGADVERALRDRSRRRRAGAAALGALALAAAAAATRASPARPRTVALVPLAGEEGEVPRWMAHGASELLRIALSESGDLRVSQGPADAAEARIVGAISLAPPALELRIERPGALPVALPPVPAGDLFAGVDLAAAAVRREVGLDPALNRSVAALTTSHPEAWRRFALAELELFEHRGARALGHARAAAAMDPSFVRAQLLVAMITCADGYASRSEGREAMAALRRLPDLGGPDQLLFAAMDAMLSQRGDEALQRFRAYLRQHPGDRFAHWLAVRTVQPPFIAARLELSRLWLHDLPEDPEPYNQLGYMQMVEHGDLTAAERHFRDGLRIAPLQANLYDSLADVLHRQARIPDALTAIERALELSPHSVSALTKAAEYAFLSDDFDRAERYARAAEARVDPEMNAFDRVVRVGAALRLVRGDVDGAASWLGGWTHRSSTGGRASIPAQAAAVSLALGGRIADSRRELDRALSISRRYHADSFPMPERYIEALAHWSDPVRLEALASALARDRTEQRDPYPASAEAVVRARLHLLRGEPARAVEALKGAGTPKFAHQNSGAWFMAQWLLGEALWQLGRLGEAAAAYDEALRRRASFGAHPETAFFWRQFLSRAARLAVEAGHEADAAAWRARLARAERLRPGAGAPSRP